MEGWPHSRAAIWPTRSHPCPAGIGGAAGEAGAPGTGPVTVPGCRRCRLGVYTLQPLINSSGPEVHIPEPLRNHLETLAGRGSPFVAGTHRHSPSGERVSSLRVPRGCSASVMPTSPSHSPPCLRPEGRGRVEGRPQAPW